MSFSSLTSMRLATAGNILLLPSELLDDVFARFDHVETLRNARLVCRVFESIYSARSIALREAVVVNALGSFNILSAALREVRVAAFLDVHNELEEYSFKEAFNGVTEDGVKDTEITWGEAKKLMVRADVCKRLEVEFSRRRKDRRTGRNSHLTPEESVRFRRAVCRVWVLSDVFRYYMSNYITEDWIFEVASRQTIFYSNFSDQDLYDINETVVWAAKEGRNDIQFSDESLIFERGPEQYLIEYENIGRSDLFGYDDYLNTFDWEGDINSQWEDRGLILEKGVPKGVRPLAEPIGSSDMCSKCNSADGLNLWNEQNWQYISSYLPFWDPIYMPEVLPQQLGLNQFETNLLRAYIEQPNGDFSAFNYALMSSFYESPYGHQHSPQIVGGPVPVYLILEELFNLQNEVNSTALVAAMAADGFATSLPNDWLCLNCLRTFVRSRYWIWWYDRKARGKVFGQSLKEDCWYGIDCPAQSDDLAHAEIYNHACLNTYTHRQARKLAYPITRSGHITAITPRP
ncbi:hypothetical protein BKA62DRAFT_214016 [Auriculariales sp. MPI-PUGE-AT-0066]|nr:hypothetical protein BKA62DRAFT_214016 [Auriculariales sp. MPI-PUGE-AT-0066]